MDMKFQFEKINSVDGEGQRWYRIVNIVNYT